MKKHISLIISIVLLSCNSITDRDSKIKDVLLLQLSKRLDKNKMEAIDSLSIVRVDSLTEKGKLFIQVKDLEQRLISYKNEYNYDSITVIQNIEHRNFYKRLGLKEDEWNREQYGKDSLSLIKSSNMLNSLQKTFDSLNQLYTKANGTDFLCFRVIAKVYYRSFEKSDTMETVRHISKDFVLEDTMSLGDYFRSWEEFKSKRQ